MMIKFWNFKTWDNLEKEPEYRPLSSRLSSLIRTSRSMPTSCKYGLPRSGIGIIALRQFNCGPVKQGLGMSS